MARDLDDEKRRLRSEMAERRRALPDARRQEAGRACAAHLLADPGLARARQVALYAALSDEVPTQELFQGLAARGVTLLLPRIESGGGLDFAAPGSWDELRPGGFGVPEPPLAAPRVAIGPGDWVVLPGLAFDRRGWRLGRGGGHYDRALASAPGVVAVGVAHAFQIVDRVPHGSQDRPVDAIVSEEGWLWCREP